MTFQIGFIRSLFRLVATNVLNESVAYCPSCWRTKSVLNHAIRHPSFYRKLSGRSKIKLHLFSKAI